MALADCRAGANDHRDAGAGVVQRRLGAGQRRAVVGHEHHPRRAVQAGGGQGVEQLPDGGVRDGDRAVELRQVLTDIVGLGQKVGHHDRISVRGVVAVGRVRTVGLEEARGQQERLPRRVGQPLRRAVHHVLAVGVGHIELVKTEPGRIRGLVLHAEKRCVPTRFRNDLRQRAHIGAVFPAVMGQSQQPVAVRVAAGEQRPPRRRAQRRGGVRAGEQNALGGELVEPRAGHVGVAVDTEITAEVVPVHDQHVVFGAFGH